MAVLTNLAGALMLLLAAAARPTEADALLPQHHRRALSEDAMIPGRRLLAPEPVQPVATPSAPSGAWAPASPPKDGPLVVPSSGSGALVLVGHNSADQQQGDKPRQQGVLTAGKDQALEGPADGGQQPAERYRGAPHLTGQHDAHPTARHDARGSKSNNPRGPEGGATAPAGGSGGAAKGSYGAAAGTPAAEQTKGDAGGKAGPRGQEGASKEGASKRVQWVAVGHFGTMSEHHELPKPKPEEFYKEEKKAGGDAKGDKGGGDKKP